MSRSRNRLFLLPSSRPRLFPLPRKLRAQRHASASQRHASLPRIAGLDGIRAVAVAVVVLYHLDFSWMPGGFLGVEVFFVVSGYLITSLLLGEYEGSLAEGEFSRGGEGGSNSGRGTISLRRFWARRARRLLPALGLLLLGVVGFVAAAFADELSDLWDQVAAAALYATNWLLIFQDQSYFETFGRPEALQHLWSLAIEEQFYLLWPVVFLGGMRWLRHRWFAAVIAVGVLASTAAMWLLYEPLEDPSRIYYGTDTRAAGLLLGALLAFAWRPWLGIPKWCGLGINSDESSQAALPGLEAARRRRGAAKRGRGAANSPQGRPWLIWTADIVGPVALAGVVGWCLYLGEFDDRLYQGGFLLLAATTALLIAAVAVPGTWFGRVMDCAPLRWLGVRSYAIYLWHWPVLVFTRPRFDVTLDGWQLHLVRIGATLVLSDLSYRFIEHPIRTRQFKANLQNWAANAHKSLRGYLVPLGAATALAVTVAVIVIPQVPARDDPPVAETFILTVSESDRQVLEAGSSLEPASREANSGETDIENPDNTSSGRSDTGTANPAGTFPESPPSDAPDPSYASETSVPSTLRTDTTAVPQTSITAAESPVPPTSPTAISAPSTSLPTSSPSSSPASPTAISPSPTSPSPSITPAPTSSPATATSSPPPTTAQEDSVFYATLPSGLPDPRPFAPPPGDWGDASPTITAFGDSIMLGTKAYLELAFGSNIAVDAEVSRQFSKLPETVADYKSDPDNPPLGDVVIIHLGTNGFLNSRVFDETMERLASVQRVLFVNVRVPRTWEDEVNRQLARGVERWDNAYLVDWHGYSAGREDDWISPNDGVHMVREGALAYAQLLQASL